MTIFQLAQYNVSRDYARLAELAKTNSIICIVDFQSCRDVAQTMFLDGRGMTSWQISARGTCYVSAFSAEEFIARCKAANLEYLEPAGA